jgi:poly-gamma-glutamate synthesis protein (capsule biosynthesis protein)
LKLREKAENEIWLISIHWGAEYFTIENPKQQQLAKKLADAGFDYIIGHHPHVVQPVRRSDKSVVFYSHGNFIFDQNFSSLTQKGLVSEINLPAGHTNLYLSQQKKYKVVSLEPISADELDSFCKRNYHHRKPLIMRIKMKLELLFRFYELNLPIIKTFTTRMFKN